VWCSSLADEPAGYLGAQACAGCHAPEFEAWKGSHHALAMQIATDATVLGDFSGARLEHFGATTTFFRDGDKFTVRTDGPDGAVHGYPVSYTFGVAFPGGRFQALGIAWDSRSKERGPVLVPPLPRPEPQARGPAALDRARPDLELPVRLLPFDRSEKELRPLRQQLRYELDRF
jgi:hypothetical protein